MYIPVKNIIVNKQGISEEHVDDFVEMIGRGWKMPPITVRKAECRTCKNALAHKCRDCDDVYWVLVDGRHRLAAHKILGKEMILAYVTL